MLLKNSFKGLSVGEVWFSVPEGFSPEKYSLCKYYGMESVKLSGKERLLSLREDKTLVSSLIGTDDEIMQKYERNVRNEVRRAEKDGAEYFFYGKDELNKDSAVLDSFETAYAEMHRQKNMKHKSKRAYLGQLAEAGALAVTVAKTDGETVVYHCYIVDEDTARLLYSVSCFRNTTDNNVRNAIGRANRGLHFADMKWLRDTGRTVYDWGGYGLTEDVLSISMFKKSFGGTEADRQYAVTTTHGFISMLFAIYKKVLGRGQI